MQSERESRLQAALAAASHRFQGFHAGITATDSYFDIASNRKGRTTTLERVKALGAFCVLSVVGENFAVCGNPARCTAPSRRRSGILASGEAGCHHRSRRADWRACLGARAPAAVVAVRGAMDDAETAAEADSDQWSLLDGAGGHGEGVYEARGGARGDSDACAVGSAAGAPDAGACARRFRVAAVQTVRQFACSQVGCKLLQMSCARCCWRVARVPLPALTVCCAWRRPVTQEDLGSFPEDVCCRLLRVGACSWACGAPRGRLPGASSFLCSCVRAVLPSARAAPLAFLRPSTWVARHSLTPARAPP